MLTRILLTFRGQYICQDCLPMSAILSAVGWSSLIAGPGGHAQDAASFRLAATEVPFLERTHPRHLRLRCRCPRRRRRDQTPRSRTSARPQSPTCCSSRCAAPACPMRIRMRLNYCPVYGCGPRDPRDQWRNDNAHWLCSLEVREHRVSCGGV